MGAYNVLFMMDKGVLPAAEKPQIRATYVAGLFRAMRFGDLEAHGRGAAMQYRYLRDKGGIVWDAKAKRFRIDEAKLDAGIRDLVGDIVRLQGNGDYAGTKAFLAKWAVMDAEAKQVTGDDGPHPGRHLAGLPEAHLIERESEEQPMGKVTGFGGVFYKVADPDKTRAWYQETLGVGGEWGAMFPFKKDDPEGFSLLSPFKQDSDYFGPSALPFMINLRVDDLDGDDRRPRRQGHRNPRPAGRGLWALRLDPRSRRRESRTLAAIGARTGMSKFTDFAALHVPGNPVVLYNIWDVGSALAVVKAGAKALATGSHPVADAHGWPDGQQVPIEFALTNAKRIVDAVELPVTVDFEGAYSVDPGAAAANVARLAATGAVGCNFEDQVIGGEGLHPLEGAGEADRRDPRGGRRCILHQRPHRSVPQDDGL